jgi:hypothetical protein
MSTRTSVSFTEEMKGHVAFGESDFDRGAEIGKADGTALKVRLHIEAPDYERFARDPRHEALASGEVDCDALGGRLPVERGSFNLFVDETGPRDKRMLYHLQFRDSAGHPLTLTGHKVVRDHIGPDLWADTTTLFTRVYAGHTEPQADHSTTPVVAGGKIHISAVDFGRQLLTFRARGGTLRARVGALLRFGTFFSASLHTVYAPPADRPAESPSRQPDKRRPSWRGPLPSHPGDQLEQRVVPYEAGDGLDANLVHVRGDRPPTRGPVLLVHGAGVRANLFRSPVRTTFTEHLVDQGYDVWLENWRASIDLPPNPWTLDQAALFDHPRAVEKVVEETGADSIKAVVHCQGSTSFMMSVAAGLVPQVSTVVTNAVSLHPVVPPISKFKIKQLVPLVGRLTRYLNPQWGMHPDTAVAKALNLLVQLTHRECDNPVCKWASFTYGTGFPTLWAHENLNPETHEWIKEEFAHVPVTFFEQMARCIEAGHLVSVEGDSRLPESFVAQAPQTDARVVFLAGENNRCFLPVSQKRTFDFFDKHRPGVHSFHVLRGYGHLDPFLGRDASQDVYPLITAELAS